MLKKREFDCWSQSSGLDRLVGSYLRYSIRCKSFVEFIWRVFPLRQSEPRQHLIIYEFLLILYLFSSPPLSPWSPATTSAFFYNRLTGILSVSIDFHKKNHVVSLVFLWHVSFNRIFLSILLCISKLSFSSAKYLLSLDVVWMCPQRFMLVVPPEKGSSGRVVRSLCCAVSWEEVDGCFWGVDYFHMIMLLRQPHNLSAHIVYLSFSFLLRPQCTCSVVCSPWTYRRLRGDRLNLNLPSELH